MYESLHFKVTESKVAFTTKLTYNVVLTYGVTAKTMLTAFGLLRKGDGVNPVHLLLINTSWKHCIGRHDLPRLCTAQGRPLRLDGLIILYLCLGDFCILVWFRIASHLALDILLGTVFIDRSMFKIFPIERKVELRNSQPVAIVACKPRDTEVNVVDSCTLELTESEQVVNVRSQP